ncbi:TPA: type III restriction endonuclease subunit R, partial [Legionella pneumophila]|nr:type III restriction endonuclease subunit R [Legionella pneumophila]
IHRVYLNEKELSINDDNTLDFFIGKRPASKNMAGQADLGKIIRKIDDLVIINDEAHHFHDHNQAGFKNIQDISNNIRIKGGKLSAQFDLTATPKYLNGSIFIQTISDYPLVEAIRQRVVKTPVLPDEASRAKLLEKKSSKYCEMYEDYLKLGVYEWKKTYDELMKVGRKALLFVMTDETSNCDEVADYLESKFPELKGAVLTIHTNKSGEIYEGNASKVKKGELEILRKQSREMDSFQSPYKAIVSVMMLREGWDVQGVVSIVGLRAFSSKAKILPEQTLGRGLRKMFRLENLQEKVSIIGTEAFMEFVQSIKSEGVELEYESMSYGDTKLHSPLVIEVDKANSKKDLEKLDIHLPVLAPRIYREYKNLEDIDVNKLKFTPVICIDFTEEEQRQIIFKNIDTEELSHITELDSELEPTYQSMISYFTNAICRDLRLFGGKEILFGKLKYFLEYK